MLYELRVYDIAPGKRAALNNRFANITTPLFRKHGIRVVGFWEDVIGTNNQLTYMLAWESLAEREEKWGTFQADTEWIKARAATEVDGPLAARVKNTIMQPTAYSPMQ